MRNKCAVLIAGALLAAGCGNSSKKTEEVKSEPAPSTYKAKLETSKGDIVIQIHRDWAPFGADRFYELVKAGFFNDARFFRVLKGFIVQFGINGNPDVSAHWRRMQIPDDPVKMRNTRGTVTFATAGPNTRTTQVFINLKNNTQLDSQGFAPFGEVAEGMDVVEQLYSGYGEASQMGGAGPDQNLIEARGNQYLTEHYPRLDYIRKATILE
jgi:peptidyl-prolyl cis-trans isomerase A (cyclophilin A)